MLFQSELGWSVLELLGRSADSGCRAPLQKRETKWISGGSLGASPMPKSVLSGGREDYLLRECIFVRMFFTFHRWGDLVFIIGDRDNFPGWMMTQNSIFHCWRIIRYSSHWVRDFLSLS